jgi:TIR domain
MPSESTNVFVSYSRADLALVSPVVKLLRLNKSFVFQDIENIQPGKRWQGEIAKALTESNLVVVFWCTHSSRSNAVSQEWQAAIEQKKDLLPLLLDPTPLPPQLAEFQWIDFRGTVGASHSSMDRGGQLVVAAQSEVAASMQKSRRPARRLLVTAAAAIFVTAAVFLAVYFSLQPWAPPDIITTPPTLITPPTLTPVASTPHSTVRPKPAAAPKASWEWLLLLVVAITVCLSWFLQHIRLTAKPAPMAASDPPFGIERHIARKVEAEILRRTRLSRGQGK